MKKIILLLFFTIFYYQSQSQPTQERLIKVRLPLTVLQIEDPNFYPILDTMILFAENQNYDFEVKFMIYEYGNKYLITVDYNNLGWKEDYGLFYYRNYLFRTTIEFPFLSKTNLTKNFTYSEREKIPWDGEGLRTFVVFDETVELESMRTFRYENGEFILEPRPTPRSR